MEGRSTEIIESLTAEGKLERLSLDKFYDLQKISEKASAFKLTDESLAAVFLFRKLANSM